MRPNKIFQHEDKLCRKFIKGLADTKTVIYRNPGVESVSYTHLVTEMSMGQMIDDIKLAVECRIPVHFYGRTGGVVPTPDEVLNEIKKLGGVQ